MKAHNSLWHTIATLALAVGTTVMISCSQSPSDQDGVTVVSRPDSAISHNYYSNRAPLQTGRLMRLPIGNIQPAGWVRACLERERDGLCGHLGEISDWLDKKDNQWLSGTGSHGWEEVPYWLRGYSNVAYLLGDEKMLAETKIWIEAVLSNCRADGLMGPANHSGERYELWAQMIMLWILQDYYDYCGDERVLTVMTNHMLWELQQQDNRFLKNYWENSRGGDNMWSVIWLYNRTGNKALLPLIDKIHNNTADWMQHDNLPNWHGVNIAQGIREPATYWLYAGTDSLIDCSYNDQQLVRRLYGQVPGGMYGSDENCRRGYVDPRQGTETCAMVEQMASDQIMLAITGDPSWADNCEDVAFNSLPAAFTPDYRALRYFVCPNMTVSDAQNHHPSIQNGGPFLAMNPFSSRCCQHNHGFGWPYYAEHMVMATGDDGLCTVFYGECTTRALVGKDGQEVTLQQQTHYPFNGQVELTLTTEADVRFPLYLRIPAWAKGTTVNINGEALACSQSEGQYIRIQRKWHSGDKVTLNMPLTITKRTWEANKNSVSVNYGPLTLSLQIEEQYIERRSSETAMGDSHWQASADESQWPTYEIFAASPWNYALSAQGSITVEERAWPADNYPFTPQSTPLVFHATGRQIPSWGYDKTGLCDVLPADDAPRAEETTPITLIPMGATRLRISAFPHE